jgi:hypothetical protein
VVCDATADRVRQTLNTMYTIHCALYAPHCTPLTSHHTLHINHWIPHTTHATPLTTYSTPHTTHSIPRYDTATFKLKTLTPSKPAGEKGRCVLYTIHSTL